MQLTQPLLQLIPESLSQPAPVKATPSSRDFQIYRLVKLEQRSTRATAEEMQLSQTRVCQIVSRVAEFLLEATPGADDEVQQRKQVQLAEQIAAERIEHLQRQAMQGFYGNVEPSDRESSESSNHHRPFAGDPRLLVVAARLALLAARLPAPRLDNLMFAEEICAECEAGDQEVSHENPPAGDCSPAPSRAPDRLPKPAADRAAKPLPLDSSVAGLSADLWHKLEQTAAVQPGQPARPVAPQWESKQVRRAAFLQG